MKFPKLYFDWLQRGSPTGKPDQLPELAGDFETSVPADFTDRDIMVVGGGVSALEYAVALVSNGNRETFSYRKNQLSSPKEQNLIAFEKMVQQGKIIPYFDSQARKIIEDSVILQRKEVSTYSRLVYSGLSKHENEALLNLQNNKKGGI